MRKFQFPRPTHSVSMLETGMTGCTLAGYVHKKPKKMSKNLSFASFRDFNGSVIQLVDNNQPSLLRGIKPESSIVVRGNVSEKINQETEGPSSTAKILEFDVKEVQVVNEASVLGSQLDASKVINWPPEHRYLELRQPEFQAMLRRRANVMKVCRESLDNQGFVEIETPILFKSTPEGAREFLVPTRKKGLMYALPQSPQQYKQLLMASGVHKYYQIARCFRDEDLRQDRQPEFTQLDLEMSFADGSDVQNVIERLVSNIWSSFPEKQLLTISEDSGASKQVHEGDQLFRLKYKDAISKYGIDKPDLRSTLTIKDLSKFAKATEHSRFTVLEALVVKTEGNASSESLAALHDPANYSHRAPIVHSVTSHNQDSQWNDILRRVNEIAEVTDASALRAHLDLKPGDIVAISTRAAHPSWENPTPLGRFRQLAIEQFPLLHRRFTPSGVPVSDNDFIAIWVTEFPLFTPREAEKTSEQGDLYPNFEYAAPVTCTHHPFTMVDPRDYDHLQLQELFDARGLHYDLVVNGVELGGGSTRVHDMTLQRYILESALGIKNPEAIFGHLLNALQSGCPPHAGLAIGFDRMVAMLSNTTSIRNVLPFPKTITGSDPVIGSPSKVTKAQLSPYHVNITH